jgi:tetratricopeptide (TPR) repeat protein
MKTVLSLALLLLALPAAAAGRRADPVEDGFKQADQLIDVGEYVRARDALDDVLGQLKSDDPRLVRYHERTGAAWLRAGKIPEARASFTAALKAAQRLKVSGDDVGKAYAGMGLVLRRESNDRYALKFFRKALEQKLDEGTRMFVDDQIREIEGAPPLPAR